MPLTCVRLFFFLGGGPQATYSNGKEKLTVAVKTLKEDSMGIEEFMQEAQVMKKLKHQNLVTLIGVVSTDMPMLIVTEFIPHGDMLTYLRRREAKAEMTQRAMLYVCTQVADGMAYLEVRVPHRLRVAAAAKSNSRSRVSQRWWGSNLTRSQMSLPAISRHIAASTAILPLGTAWSVRTTS